MSWREQLASIRDDVEQMAARREEEQRLRLERSRESLKERLQKDTPEGLRKEFQDLRRECDRAARRFFPPDGLQAALDRVLDFEKRMLFYQGCRGEFADLFSTAVIQAIDGRMADIQNVKKGLDRQLGQWREVQEALEDLAFRARTEADDKPLVQAAKSFNERAHSISLSAPADFFAGEGEAFHIVVQAGQVIGYVKYWDDRDVVTLAVYPAVDINFPKFVRGVLYRAYQGPLADKKQDRARVRLSMSREVKFFTDLGFVRKETVSVNEWIFERPLS